METFKNICTAILIGFLCTFLSLGLESQFLSDFFKDNLIMLLIALLAINTTTLSIILTKLKEIEDKHNIDFSLTIKQMKFSIYEQIILISIGVFLQIANASKIVFLQEKSCKIILLGLLTSVLVYSIYILYDTASGIFIIVDYEKDKQKK